MLKSRAGIRSTYSPPTARLIGWLSRWPYTLRIYSVHNETCPAALTLGFNQNVAHCLKDKGSLTKSVTEPTMWGSVLCCEFVLSAALNILYSDSQSFFYESD